MHPGDIIRVRTGGVFPYYCLSCLHTRPEAVHFVFYWYFTAPGCCAWLTAAKLKLVPGTYVVHTCEYRYLLFTARFPRYLSAATASSQPVEYNFRVRVPCSLHKNANLLFSTSLHEKRCVYISSLDITHNAKDVRSCKTKALPDLDWREKHTTVPDLVLVELPSSVACAVVGSDSGGHFWPADKKSRSQLTAQQASHNALRQTRLIVQAALPYFPTETRYQLRPGASTGGR